MSLKFTKVLYLSIAFSLLSNYSFSQAPSEQQKFALKQMVPTSPEAALLGRFGDIPIGYYTGTAEMSIPLYKIKEGDVEVPIELNYHSSGIRVEDQASDVGLGWLMEPGGAVIQIVNGKEDALDHLLYNSMYPGTITNDYTYLRSHVTVNGIHGGRNQIGTACLLCDPTDGSGDSLAELQGLMQGWGQPDIYQYSFPGGYSGKFYIDPGTMKPIIIDKKREVTFTNTDGGWLATTLDGDKFYFQAQESVLLNGNAYVGYTWKLSKIVLNDSKIINFNYTSGQYDWQSESESYHTTFPIASAASYMGMDAPLPGYFDALPVPSGSGTHSSTLTLNQISTDNEIINFNLEARADMPTTRVKSIDIKSTITNKLIKSFNFSYDYFAYTTAGGTYFDSGYNPYASGTPPADYIAKRLKLLSVQEIGYDASMQPVIKPAYQFTYDVTNPLPLKTSLSKDFWGYYNGANNEHLVPDLSYFYAAGELSQNFPYYILSSFQGANRVPDKTKITAGMLTQITYPTGGSTQFTYELNSFTNYNYPDADKVGMYSKFESLQDQNDVSSISSYTFTLPRHMVISFQHFFGKGVSQNTVTFDDMLNATITLTKTSGGTTTQLKQWRLQTASRNDFNNNGYVTINDTYDFAYDANAQYKIVCDLPDNLGDQASVNKEATVQTNFKYYNIPTVQTQASYGGGVRIAGIKNYDNNGALISNKAIKYINADGSSSGIIMSPLQYISPRTMHFEWLYHVPAGTSSDPLATNLVKNIGDGDVWWMSSESDVPLSNAAGGNIVGYSRVEETELANSVATNGKKVYYYNNHESETSQYTPDSPDLLNGMMSKEEVYDVNNNKFTESDYNYVSRYDTTFMGFKAINNVVLNYTPCQEMSSFYTPLYPSNAYTILTYPINTHWYVLDNKVNTAFFNGTGVITTENYTYNKLGQVTSSTTTNSALKTIKHQYLFPYDVNSSPGSIESSLKGASLYNSLLEDDYFVNGSQLSTTKISYNSFNGQLAKSKIEFSTGTNPLTTTFTFDDYWPNKALKQVSESGVRPSSLLWNDNNTFVVAECKNSGSPDLAYTSFEPGQAGNWTIGSTTRVPGGITGGQSYSLSNGPLTKNGLTSSHIYIVSYWTTNSTPISIAGTISGYPQKGQTINGWTYYQHLVTGQTSITLSGSGNIDEVRLYPSNAQMTSYTYDPLIGMTSSTDAKNETTYYEYDSFQRLRNIKDKDGNILKNYCYNYAGQQTGCPIVTGTGGGTGTGTGNPGSVVPYITMTTASSIVDANGHTQRTYRFNAYSDAAHTVPYNVTGNITINFKETTTTTYSGGSPPPTTSNYTYTIVLTAGSNQVTTSQYDMEYCPSGGQSAVVQKQATNAIASPNSIPPGGQACIESYMTLLNGTGYQTGGGVQ